jgi:hypothetical protein
MPAIKKVSYTTVFSQLNNASFAAGETNDCGVKAVALVATVPYDVARQALADRGRKARKGTYTHDILATVRAAGKEVTQVNPRDIIARYPSPHRNVLRSVTTHHPRRFNKVWPKGRYLLFSKRHVSAVIDGELHDWAINSAKRVQAIYEVK